MYWKYPGFQEESFFIFCKLFLCNLNHNLIRDSNIQRIPEKYLEIYNFRKIAKTLQTAYNKCRKKYNQGQKNYFLELV